MTILNLGCGYPRMLPPFLNMDNLHAEFGPERLERRQLDAEGNYVNHDVTSGPLPFEDNHFDGILASHFFEHFKTQDAIKIMHECKRILKPGGSLLVSVPDASYFRQVFPEDNKENGMRLFGECMDAGNPNEKHFDCYLFFDEHAAVLTEDALWCYFTRVRFNNVLRMDPHSYAGDDPVMQTMHGALNRRKFSLVMGAAKP